MVSNDSFDATPVIFDSSGPSCCRALRNGNTSAVRLTEGWRSRLDPPHCVLVKDPFAAIAAFVKCEVSNRVAEPLRLRGPVFPHRTDVWASARWARANRHHGCPFLCRALGRDQENSRPSSPSWDTTDPWRRNSDLVIGVESTRRAAHNRRAVGQQTGRSSRGLAGALPAGE